MRLKCCVPFCRGTRGLRKGETVLPDEWICSVHWRAVPATLKRVRSRLRRRRKKLGHMTAVMRGINFRSWELCKRKAIEAAGGIA